MPNNRSFARAPKFWNYGFCIHLTVLALIATAAYLGILPTTYRAIPYYDLLG
ncbi:hypothetical protein GF339_23830, partial [candidate division KSB3 bacterium]|nr:hypothetical protein [candidate division KSB3 bacterium]MBD3327634.1 hypothetical protein [candidate division KSB3 bacterium]